jgi:hypothetical protein
MGRAAIQQTDWLWMLATGSELARPDGERAGIPCRAAARRPHGAASACDGLDFVDSRNIPEAAVDRCGVAIAGRK